MEPWYHKGLKFTCTHCGDCCTGAPGYVWVNQEERRALASFLGLTPERFMGRYVRRIGTRYSLLEKPGGDCVFYEHGCTVYPARPRQCRTYPFWPENLRERAAWEATERECPGAGQGRLYRLEEIERIRRGGAETRDGGAG